MNTNKVISRLTKELEGISTNPKYDFLKKATDIELIETLFVGTHELGKKSGLNLSADKKFAHFIAVGIEDIFEEEVEENGLGPVLVNIITSLSDRLATGCLVDRQVRRDMAAGTIKKEDVSNIEDFESLISPATFEAFQQYKQSIGVDSGSTGCAGGCNCNCGSSTINPSEPGSLDALKGKALVDLLNRGVITLSQIADELDAGNVKIDDLIVHLSQSQAVALMMEGKSRAIKTMDDVIAKESQNSEFSDIPEEVKKAMSEVLIEGFMKEGKPTSLQDTIKGMEKKLGCKIITM